MALQWLNDLIAQGSELPWRAWLTLGVLVVTLIALVREIASPDLVMVAALAFLLATGCVSPEVGLSGFSEPAVVAIGSLFVLASVVRRTGALSRLYRLMEPRSDHVVTAILRLMVPASAFSAFMNNTPLVALLVPQVQQWARRIGIAPSKLLIPLSYATILGGMCTLIGTSTNLVVSGLLHRETGIELGVFELAWVGLPALAVGLVYFATLGHRLLPEREDSPSLASRSLKSYQFELRVPEDSALVDKSVADAGLRHLRDAFLAHIVRNGRLFGPVAPDFVIEAGDILAFFGSTDLRSSLIETKGLRSVVDPPAVEGETQHLPLFEAVVSANSSLQGRTLRQIDFRNRFQAVVVGIHRSGRRLRGQIGRVPLETGDLLLLEAPEGFANAWVGSGEFYLVAPLERPEAVDNRRAPWVLGLVLATVVAASTGFVPLAVAAFAAAVIAAFLGRLTSRELRRSLDLTVLLVVAAAFGIARTMHETGLDTFLATQVGAAARAVAPVLGPLGALAVLYLLTNLLTEILTNNVAAVMVLPIGLEVASQADLSARACAVVVAIAASASFATPIGYQTNLMVLGPGGYRFRDYLRVGLPLNLLVFAVTLLVVHWRWM